MRCSNLRLEAVLRQCGLDARDEIAAVRLIVGMLELAAPALGKVAARRLLVMRPGRKRPVIEQGVARNAEPHVPAARRHAVTPRRDPDDQFVHSWIASGMASARSSAIICGPAISAARP